LGRQPPTQLVVDPLLAFMVLAVGAVSVSTGMGDIGLLGALMVGTLGQHVRSMALSALGHGPEGVFMSGQDNVFVLLQKGVPELVDD
jgi:hypothetical protein